MLGESSSQNPVGYEQMAPASSSLEMQQYVDEPAGGGSYRLDLSLRLPTDRSSAPLVRHVTRFALKELDVVQEVIDDVELALSEACANVLEHAGSGDAYDVMVTIRPDRCELRVIDVGHGFDQQTVNHDMPHPDGNRGRGMALMHALMDQVQLISEPERGTLVLLARQLSFQRPSLEQQRTRHAADQEVAQPNEDSGLES